MTTILTVRELDYEGEPSSTLAEKTTLTQPLSDAEVIGAIRGVVARVDRGYALDLVTVLQIQARTAADTGERLTLDEFARVEGWADELKQLRSE